MNLLHHKHNRPFSKRVREYTRRCLCDKGRYGLSTSASYLSVKYKA